LFYGPDPNDSSQMKVITMDASSVLPIQNLIYPNFLSPLRDSNSQFFITIENISNEQVKLHVYNFNGSTRHLFENDMVSSYQYIYQGYIQAKLNDGSIQVYDTYGRLLVSIPPLSDDSDLSIVSVLNENNFYLRDGEEEYLYDGTSFTPIQHTSVRKKLGVTANYFILQDSNELYIYEEDGTKSVIQNKDINEVIGEHTMISCTSNYIFLSQESITISVYDYDGNFIFKGIPITRKMLNGGEIALIEADNNEYFLVKLIN
jgi:hypothetical protein